ncbi:MAG: TetR family transcriptional regulator [Endozoicomonas sp.]
MVRRTKEEAEETRRFLLKTALKLFSERGIKSVTLAQIAKEAGVTRGAIYWHFRDKADMLNALWVTISGPLETMYRPLMESLEGDPLDLLEEVARSFFLQLADNDDMQQICRISAQAMGDPDLEASWRSVCQKEQQGLEGLLQRAKDFGSLAQGVSAECASLVYTGYLDGVVGQWMFEKQSDPDWLKHEADTLAKLVIKGLRC